MTDVIDSRERWALVLGSSSGFGGAAAKALARAGYGIVGVHLDLRASRADADAVRDEIAAMGVPVVFHNVNAADAAVAPPSSRTSRLASRRVEATAPLRSWPSSCTPWPSARRSPMSPPTPRRRSSRRSSWR